MQTVNRVLCFDILTNAYKLRQLFPNYKRVSPRPNMMVYKANGNTLLVFQSGKARLLGKVDNQADVLKKIQFRNITVSTMTIIYDFKQNFDLGTLPPQIQWDPELFNAAFYKFKKIHLNIFHTGKIVILGAKKTEEAAMALNSLINILFINNIISIQYL